MKTKLLSFLLQWLDFTLPNPTAFFLRRRLRAFAPNFNGKVLDVGAGDQPYRKLFRNIGEYHATNTRRHYQINNLEPDEGTDFWIDDASSLPFENESYDGLLCFQVLSVLENPAAFFEEMKRVLIAGAPVLLSTDFIYPLWSSEDYMRHSVHHLAKLAENHGFEVVEIQSLGSYKTLRFSLLSRYLKYYPARLMKMNQILLLPSAVFYLFMLLLSPLIGFAGRLACSLERNIRDEFTFSPFLLVFMRKKGDVQ